MVKREEKSQRHTRLAFYFPTLPRRQKWIQCLREVVEAVRKVEMRFEVVSAARVDVVWPHYVTWQSANRLTKLAAAKDTTFRLLGEPQGILDEPVEAAGQKEAALTEVRTAKPETAKRRRLMRKTKSCRAASATATSRCPVASSRPAPPAAPSIPAATGEVIEKTVGATSSGAFDMATADIGKLLPLRLLLLKWEETCRQEGCISPYDMCWEKPLGKGAFGVVYPACLRGTGRQVAIKVFE